MHMTIASFISRRRRELALCGASVLLHLLALAWLVPQLGLASAPRPAALPATITARLLAEPPASAPASAPAALPAVSAKPPARKRRAPLPTAAPPGEPATAGQGGAAEILSDVQSVQPATVEAVPPAAAPVESIPAQPEPAAAAQARRYRVDMPPSAEIVLDVERSDADGTLWHGEAVMAWTLKGDSYRMKVEAGIRVLVARVNLVLLESEGKIGETGFAPVTMTEKRRGRALTATHFSERDGRITFSASPAAVPMLPGTQDKATVPLQLAAIARGGSGQLGGGIEMLVGEDKDASVFRFVLLGVEELDTRLGKMQAWHLSRPPQPGSYGSRLDIWLAPGHGWYPVQIRNIEASGAVTTQTVNKIVITDSGT
jgi:hypothetical protein